MKKTIIAIHALQGAGKTTVCGHLEKILPRTARVNVKDSFSKYANLVIDAIIQDGLMTPEEATLLWRKQMFKSISIGGELGKTTIWSDAYAQNVRKALSSEAVDFVLTDDCRTIFNIDALRKLQKDFNVIVISLVASEETRRKRCSAWREGNDYTEQLLDPEEGMQWLEIDAEMPLEVIKADLNKIFS